MIFDYDRLIGEVRLDCHEPEGHAPNDDIILQKSGDVAQLLVNELANAPPGWSQRFYDLDVQPGQPFYPLPIDKAFSKPVRIHTVDPGYPFHVTRKIDMCDRQNADEFYGGPRQALTGWPKHTARVMIISWDLSEPQIEVVPEPSEPARYRIWYNTGIIPEPLQTQKSPVPLEYFRYWRVETSLLTLRYCHWRGGDQDARKMEIATIEPVLIRQSGQFKAAWEQYKLTNRVTGSQEPNAYAAYYLDYDPYL